MADRESAESHEADRCLVKICTTMIQSWAETLCNDIDSYAKAYPESSGFGLCDDEKQKMLDLLWGSASEFVESSAARDNVAYACRNLRALLDMPHPSGVEKTAMGETVRANIIRMTEVLEPIAAYSPVAGTNAKAYLKCILQAASLMQRSHSIMEGELRDTAMRSGLISCGTGSQSNPIPSRRPSLRHPRGSVSAARDALFGEPQADSETDDTITDLVVKSEEQ